MQKVNAELQTCKQIITIQLHNTSIQLYELWIIYRTSFALKKSEIETELQNLISWKIFSTTGFIMKEEFYFANWNLNFQFQSKSAENWKSFPAPTLLQACTGWDAEDNHEWMEYECRSMKMKRAFFTPNYLCWKLLAQLTLWKAKWGRQEMRRLLSADQTEADKPAAAAQILECVWQEKMKMFWM